jgi:hypothetical protein
MIMASFGCYPAISGHDHEPGHGWWGEGLRGWWASGDGGVMGPLAGRGGWRGW